MAIRHHDSPLVRQKRILVMNRRDFVGREYGRRLEATMRKYDQPTPGWLHARWRDIRDDHKKDRTAFAMVRNPWSRVVSRYTFALHVAGNRGVAPRDVGGRRQFLDFLDMRHEWGGKPYFWHRAILGWYPQKDYVVDEDGELRCDILRFEHFDEDTMAYFGLGSPLGFRNVSNGDRAANRRKVSGRRDYREYYDAETRGIVEDWYRDDVEFFGFDFDGPATRNIWASGKE